MRATVSLRFYFIWDEGTDSGRYLQVRTPNGSITVKMTAFDWPHYAHTSLYLTPRREIGVLGPMGDDWLISLDPLGSRNRWARGSEDDWTYLGAFDYDYQSTPRGGDPLRFFSAAEQAECIPIASYMGRKSAQHSRCP